VRRWARSLQHVRFCHPADRYVLDRELFEVAIKLPATEADALELCGRLGLHVEKIDDLRKAREHFLAGTRAHVVVRHDAIEIFVAPWVGPHSVDESDYVRAKAIDDLLGATPGLEFRDPPRDDDSCVSPKFYPRYWRSSWWKSIW
jgi:hypothetical protein